MRWFMSTMASALWLVLSGGIALAQTELPRYTVETSSDDLEVRRYAPSIAAEVAVTGDRDGAVSDGFRILAGYIFGGNEPAAKIAMTAPVTQQPGQTIAMTAPVTQAEGEGGWTVRFGMPASWTMATLRRPTDRRICLVDVPEHRIAAVRFSGLRTDSRLATETRRLAEFVRGQSLTPVGPPIYAYYDPPWTLPFLRRNEILQQVR